MPSKSCARPAALFNDKFPAGIVTLRGNFAQETKEEMIRLARHQEEAERKKHPLNRIINIEEDEQEIVIKTTHIHLPRLFGKAVTRAFYGEIDEEFENNGCGKVEDFILGY